MELRAIDRTKPVILTPPVSGSVGGDSAGGDLAGGDLAGGDLAGRMAGPVRAGRFGGPVYGPALLLMLAACGGGGGGSPVQKVETKDVDLAKMKAGVAFVMGADGIVRAVQTGIAGEGGAGFGAAKAANGGDGLFAASAIVSHAEGARLVTGLSGTEWDANAATSGAGKAASGLDAKGKADGTLPMIYYQPSGSAATITGLNDTEAQDGVQVQNVFLASAGAISWHGGTGASNILSYEYAPGGVTLNLGQGHTYTQDAGTNSWADGDRINVNILSVRGSEFADVFYGGPSADNIFEGLGGADSFYGHKMVNGGYGGSGRNTVSYQASEAGVTVDLARDGAQVSKGDASGDSLHYIQNLTGSQHGDELSGDEADNVFAGLGGADRIDGRAGIDTASYAASKGGVSVDLATSRAKTGGDAQGDVLISIENLIGSAGDDWLAGDGKVNKIEGGFGADVIEGRAGADVLDGGGNQMKAGKVTKSWADTVSYASFGREGFVSSSGPQGSTPAGSSLGVVVDLSNSGAQALAYGALTGGNITDFSASDYIVAVRDGAAIGDSWTVSAKDGTELATLISAGKTYQVLGRMNSSGTDLEAGHHGSISWDGQKVVVDDAGTSRLGNGDAAGDRLSNFENLTGSRLDDVLTGDDAANLISGGAGADVIDGGAGVDTLTYAGSSAAVTLDLGASKADLQGATNSDASKNIYVKGTGGDADGDLVINIENITGSAFADTLSGDAGDNILRGEGGADVLKGAAGDDTLWGGSGFDNLSGGAGDDLIEGGSGHDIIDGGDGIDTVSYSKSSAGVVIDLERDGSAQSGGDAVNDGQGDRIRNVENLIGSDHDDSLKGNSLGDGANKIWGRAGDDRIWGRSGDDSLYGEAGDDHLYGNDGDDMLVGGAGDDVLSGNADDDTLLGGAGNDRLEGGDGMDSLTGGAGDDFIFGGQHDDTIYGGFGADQIDGGAGFDTLDYSSVDTAKGGVKILVGNGSSWPTGSNRTINDSFSGAANQDVITQVEYIIGSDADDTMIGDDGDTYFEGGAGADTIHGGSHVSDSTDNDLLAEVGGSATIYGDWARYSTYSHAADEGNAGVVIDLSEVGQAANQGTANTSNGSLSGAATNQAVYAVRDSASTGWTLTKAASNPGNRFWVKLASIGGTSGALTLEATAAAAAMGIVIAEEAASLTSATGLASTTHIGVGTDNKVYFKGNIVIGNGHASGDQLTDIENIYGSAHNDVLTGNNAQNVLEGGAGKDDLDGGAGIDTASYAGSSAAVTVTINATSGNTGGDAEGDKLYNIENLVGSDGDDTLTGDGGDNIIYGGKGADTIKGLGGRDTLYGNEGDDLLTGGEGADTIYGGSGTDTVFYTGATAHATGYTMSSVTYTGVIVNLGTGAVKGAAAETTSGGTTYYERLRDVENVTGSAHDDHITGDAGANVLDGAAGDDWLDGAGGNDTLTGGAGADTLSGGAGNDKLSGGAGNDELLGGAGDDTLTPGAGNDVLDGGVGADTADYTGSGAITIDLSGTKVDKTGSANQDSAQNLYIKGVGGDAADDVLKSVEHIIGTANNDTLTGDTASNTLKGMGGNDTLIGGNGDDRLEGGAGNDSLTGDAGDDTLVGGAGEDRLTGGDGNDVYVVDIHAATEATADAVKEFTSGDRLDFGDITHVWFKNSTNAATGHTDNDGSTNDTIIYAGNADNSAADTAKILAILEDYTDDLVAGDLLGSVTLAEI